jgi:hypothetical protein
MMQYTAYQAIFDYFNDTLFDGTLPDVMLVFSKDEGARGQFISHAYRSEDQSLHEISLNPIMLNTDPESALSTLCHEMCHLWQTEYGTPGNNGYHNKEWGDKMEYIGLIPSNTGMPGGEKTGTQMTHYIQQGGRFEKAYQGMPKKHLFPFQSTMQSEPKPVSSHTEIITSLFNYFKFCKHEIN